MTFVACLFLSIGMALAQSRVSGKVTSAEDAYGREVVKDGVKLQYQLCGTETCTEKQPLQALPVPIIIVNCGSYCLTL